MRILSPASDLQTPSKLCHEAENGDLKVNETAEFTSTNRMPTVVATSTIPTVILDTDVVSENMAARLCISFLSHVLFLKSQIPFPIVQLARIPTTEGTTRASKKRCELLNSFDTLASHLYTTFIALSTALALRGTSERVKTALDLDPCYHQKHGVATTFLVVALGPIAGTAKSRVIIGIRGFETKVWGLQEDHTRGKNVPTHDTSDEKENHVESARDVDDDYEGEGEGEGEQNGSDSEGDDECASESDSESPPISTGSPSPTQSTESLPPLEPLSNAPSKSPLPRVEDPETVRVAERLLSRTLANVCAEDDGYGLVSEIAPTQIHVLLRAPRRFNHPSWIPRQNLCPSFDGSLADFLVESGESLVSCTASTKKKNRAGKVQGIWVKAHGSDSPVGSSEEDLAEEDELIWWSWEGKLAGFADW